MAANKVNDVKMEHSHQQISSTREQGVIARFSEALQTSFNIRVMQKVGSTPTQKEGVTKSTTNNTSELFPTGSVPDPAWICY